MKSKFKKKETNPLRQKSRGQTSGVLFLVLSLVVAFFVNSVAAIFGWLCKEDVIPSNDVFNWDTVMAIIVLPLAIVQAALLGGVAGAFEPRLTTRLKWILPLLVTQFLLLTAPFIGLEKNSNYLVAIAIYQLLVFFPAWLVSQFLRWMTGRNLRHANRVIQSEKRFHISIRSLLLVTFLVGSVFSVVRSFPEEATGWSAIGYAILVAVGVYVGAPAGILIPLLLWPMLSKDRHNFQRGMIALGIAFGGLLLLAVSLTDESNDNWLLSMGLSNLFLATALSGFSIRLAGFRLLPKDSAIVAVHDD